MITKGKILLLISLLVAAFSFSGAHSLRAENTDSGDEIPEWLERVNYGIDFGTDQRPLVYFETVQPLYQTLEKDANVFVQSRVNIRNANGIYNIGAGHRRLFFDDRLLLGLNSFFDYEDQHDHYRAGAGFEAIGKNLELRVNTYFGLSRTKLVDETSSSTTYERAVDGADVELGGAIIPYVPQLKIYGSGYWYDYKKFKDKEGWRVRTRLDITKWSHIDFIVWDDNKGDTEYRSDIAVKIPFYSWMDIRDIFKISREAYPDRDLKEDMLKRVERSNEITVEKWMNTGTATIEIKRAD